MNEHGYTKSSDESIDSIAQALTEEAERDWEAQEAWQKNQISSKNKWDNIDLLPKKQKQEKTKREEGFTEHHN